MKNTLTILTLLVGTSFLVSAEVNATSFNDYMKQANKYAKDAAAVASKEVVKAATPAAKQLAQKALQEAEKVVMDTAVSSLTGTDAGATTTTTAGA